MRTVTKGTLTKMSFFLVLFHISNRFYLEGSLAHAPRGAVVVVADYYVKRLKKCFADHAAWGTEGLYRCSSPVAVLDDRAWSRPLSILSVVRCFLFSNTLSRWISQIS